MAGRPRFFDAEERLRWLSASGDPLERVRAVVDFEAFRAEPEAALSRADRSRGGRPPWKAVLMSTALRALPSARVLVLLALYTLSDDQAEHQLRDRLSFMRFAGLALQDAVPDAKAIWLSREQLTRAGALARLFARFDAVMAERGFLAMGGQIVDATVVEARRPRLTKDEKQTLRDGGTPAGWSKARARQIDRDGRWTLRRGRKVRPPEGTPRRAVAEIAVPMFGCKNHLGVDRAHGFIRRFVVTDAARHDGAQLGAVLDPANTGSGIWADTAYRSKANLELLDRRGLRAEFQRAKPRGRPMPARIASGNATRARVRGVVEPVFAAEKRRMGLVVRGIGRARSPGWARFWYDLAAQAGHPQAREALRRVGQ